MPVTVCTPLTDNRAVHGRHYLQTGGGRAYIPGWVLLLHTQGGIPSPLASQGGIPSPLASQGG